MINLTPKKCNLCNGLVVYITNDKIYGKKYGSGFCYLCTKCYAYVGTHIGSPRTAMGILADKEMRVWKQKCHNLFDCLWKGKKAVMSRESAYKRLARKMNKELYECHFGYFNLEELEFAYLKTKEIMEEVKDGLKR